ncbi:MAG TPA: hypothetical protein VGD01_07240 [Candidatus Elarobacter sp.]
MKPAFALQLAALSALALASGALPAAAATVTTLAGSGAPGVRDGAGAAATFLMPTGLAYLPNGDLLVADTAAQRIRAVSPAGVVRTVAGAGELEPGRLSVPGGYLDGPAASARFNAPRGIAVGRDGTVYIADSGNHCVRTLRDGVVRTLAGDPKHAGSPFSRPIGIAVDAEQTVLVADPEAGMKTISKSGAVTAVAGFRAPFGVGVQDTPHGQYLFGIDADGVLERLPNSTADRRLRSANQPRAAAAASAAPGRTVVEYRLAGEAPLGYPAMVSVLRGISQSYLFYGDPRTNTIRFLAPDAGRMRIVAGRQTEDASGRTAGYADGDGAAAAFDAPTGTASFELGTLAVADTGNRRIRLVRYDPDAYFADESDQSELERDYRIGYAGNSFTQFDAAWSDSTAALVQQQLRRDLGAAGAIRPVVRVVPGLTLPATWDSLAQTVAATGLYKALVLNLNVLNLSTSTPSKRGAEAVFPQVTQHLIAMRTSLAAAGIPLIVALHPTSPEIDPGETLSARVAFADEPYLYFQMPPDLSWHDRLKAAVEAAGVPLIDAYPDFIAEERAPSARLFGNEDTHFTPRGRAVMARALAHGLEVLEPWAGRKP